MKKKKSPQEMSLLHLNSYPKSIFIYIIKMERLLDFAIKL